MLSLRRYLVSLAVVVAAWGAYALLVAPWLEPPRPTRANAQAGEPLATPDIQAQFEGLFAPGSWELDDPKIVETEEFTLLLNDYQPLPDGKMKIEPCTLIFYAAEPASRRDKNSPLRQRRPIVLRALEGAELQFDRPLDVGTASVGRLVEGRLKGSIRIFGPPTAPGANDALELSTRNVKINREKVYTPHEVAFRYGSSFGNGRDLTITLQPKDETKKGSSSLGGISLLQLARVERLHLEGNSALLPEGPDPAGAAKAKAARQEAPLEVRCAGPLTVDFDDSVAAIEDQVEISRVYPQGLPDRLLCDRLIFHLRRPGRGRVSAEKEIDPAGPVDAQQFAEQIESVVAQGRPVILEAPQAEMHAKASEVRYFAVNRRVELASASGVAEVELKRGQNEFRARKIEYELADGGRLGRLWADGPGWLKFTYGPAGKSPPVEARWQQTLRIEPQHKNKVISLTGQPWIGMGPDNSFSALPVATPQGSQPGQIHLWVLEVPLPASAPAAPRADASGAIKEPPQKVEIIPDRLLAVGAVEVDSPQLAAHTRQLKAWFVHQAPPEAPAETSPRGMFDPAKGDKQPKPDERAPAIRKLDVTGDDVQLQIIRRGAESAVEDLAISGQVHVQERIDPQEGTAPLTLDGDLVTLRRGTSPDARLEIRGRPAKVAARGMSLSGATIHLRRVDNRLWIPGPGEAVLPMTGNAADPTAPPPPSAPPQPPRPIQVTWQEAFEFDGQTGVFSGLVQARGQFESASCANLTFMLGQKIDFLQPQEAGRIEIARIEFDGGGQDVALKRVTMAETKDPAADAAAEIAAVDNVRVKNLVIDRTTGKLHADGPGEVWTNRRDAGPVTGQVPAAPPPPAGKLTYLCITFQGGIEGDLNRREIEFQDRVRTIYGPVDRFDQRLKVERVEDLGESGIHVKSNMLTVTEMWLPLEKKRWIEVNARGNAIAEGRAFVAQAERIGYSSDKEQLVVAGDGRSLAHFWHVSQPGAEPSHATANRFLYQRSTNMLEFDGARNIDVSELPRDGSRPPKTR